jgi:SAM-dependent methyltransferase
MQGSFDQMAEMGFSEACERNKDSILQVLQEAFRDCKSVLEIGSGTGQHVVHFGRALGHIHFQPTDIGGYLKGLRIRLRSEASANIADAIELDVRMDPWPVDVYDGVFSANTMHYMGVDCVEAFFEGVGRVLRPGGRLAVYGPFRYVNSFTSASNERFHEQLRQSDPVRGIRDFEWINALAAAQHLVLERDQAMPANNQILVWCRETGA